MLHAMFSCLHKFWDGLRVATIDLVISHNRRKGKVKGYLPGKEARSHIVPHVQNIEKRLASLTTLIANYRYTQVTNNFININTM